MLYFDQKSQKQYKIYNILGQHGTFVLMNDVGS